MKLKWRMYTDKSEKYFREQALILYKQGRELDYISRVLNLESEKIWDWIKDEMNSDLYVDFNGVWRLVQSNYFCDDFQGLANSISRRIKVIFKKNKEQQTYQPKKVKK